MNRRLTIILCCVVFFTSGCFSSSPKRTAPVSSPTLSATGQVIKPDIFKKGGTLVILPFKAGTNAVASPQLDRVSLMMVKGAVDYLQQEKTPFKVLTTQDQGSPDLVIDGYINDFIQPGKMKRWVMQNRKTVLSVEGYMEIPNTKERIMVVQHKRSAGDPKKDGLDVAYRLGQDLGRFIVDAVGE